MKFSNVGGKILPIHAFMESLVAIADGKPRMRQGSVDYDGGLMALLKVAAGRALEEAVREAQQVMGGIGYSRTGKGARVEQISRDVRVMVVGGGSEEILNGLAFTQERKDLNAIMKARKIKSLL